MKKIIFLLLIVLSASAQIKKPMMTTKEFEIESGKTLLKYKDGKLDTIITAMYAVNYGNLITLSRTKDTIYGEMADSKNSKIKIFFNKQYLIKELYYKNKPIFTMENLEANLKKLPANAQISGLIINNLNNFYSSKNTMVFMEYENLDKIFKLYATINLTLNLKSLDAVFEDLGTFFSKEDCLIKVYDDGKYPSTFTAFFITDDNGKVKDGIVWKTKDNKIGISETFKNGKIIQSEQLILKNFQKAIEKYAEKNIE